MEDPVYKSVENTDSVESVVEVMQQMEKLFSDRNKQYGNSFEAHGEMMKLLFPNGVTLETAEQFTRFGVINMMASKFFRSSVLFNQGGHADSSFDLAVYSAMLNYLERQPLEF